MPGVTFKISDDCYSPAIGQLDWIAAQREQEPTTGVGTLMGTDGKCHLQGIRTPLNQSRLLAVQGVGSKQAGQLSQGKNEISLSGNFPFWISIFLNFLRLDL